MPRCSQRAGITTAAGEVNIPLNVAVVLGNPGTRVSFLTGFNMNRRVGDGDTR